MNESKKNQIEIGVILIFLAFGAFTMWQSKTSSGKSASLPKISEVTGFNLDEAGRKFENLELPSKEKNGYQEGHFRNIFQKPGEVYELEKKALSENAGDINQPGTSGQKLVLEGTMWGGDKKIAIISGHVVCEGDMIDNAKVLKIMPDRVVLSQNGSETELKR